MKKPINKFAVALWIVAVLVFVAVSTQFLTMYQSAREMAGRGETIYIVAHNVWGTLISGIGAPVQLAALGIIIELIDQIRWNALQQRSK